MENQHGKQPQREVYVNVDRDAIFGTDWCETWTNNIGKLFRAAQQEYGKCVGRMRRDLDNDPSAYTTVETGWIFQSMQRYTDTRERYMREVWVELKPVYAPGTDNSVLGRFEGGQITARFFGPWDMGRVSAALTELAASRAAVVAVVP